MSGTENKPTAAVAAGEAMFTWTWLSSFRTTGVLKIGYLGVTIVPLISYAIVQINAGEVWIKLIADAAARRAADSIAGIDAEIVTDRIAETASRVAADVAAELADGAVTSLPPSLFWLFAGSVLLAIAHFMNEIRCPYIIKRYGSLDEYREQLAKAATYQEAIEKHDFEVQKGVATKLVQRIDNKINRAEADVIARAATEVLHDVLKEEGTKSVLSYASNWDRQNSSRPFARYAISGLYSVSALIIFCLILRQLWIVLQAAFPGIF